ncbi:MAG TPA: 50S ribosomal protein L25 [Solirubrobacteraceae bacterium]|nr:50S ribosomal protein L25 [Solirubrobacteraceae bacterium]
MAVTAPRTLELTSRAAEGSRSARRLRRSGQVPGVIYGGGEEPQLFAADARVLRNTLAHAGAILEVSLDGGGGMPVLVKDVQRHPVRGEAVHVDLLRVRMDEKIHTTVVLELVGADTAPGVVQGGVLSQGVVELNIEALPGDIPDSVPFDVSGLDINETATLASVPAPSGVTFLDDPETVVATVTPPSEEAAPDEIETETERVGDPTVDEVAERQAEGDTSSEAEQAAGDS